MNYNLKLTGIESGYEVREYLEKKLESIEKFLGNKDSARADIELAYLESEEKSFKAECTMHDGVSLRADERGATLHEAIDKMAAEVTRELNEMRKKQIDEVREGGLKAKEMLREGEEI